MRSVFSDWRYNAPYSSVMPADLTIREALSYSAFRKLAKPAGVCCAAVAASKPRGVSLSSTEG